MAYRLIIEENTIYEIDEECERLHNLHGGYKEKRNGTAMVQNQSVDRQEERKEDTT